jgi:hypothetical protein
MLLLPREKPHCKGNGEKRVNKLPHEDESSGVESGSVASVTEGEEPGRRNGREGTQQNKLGT